MWPVPHIWLSKSGFSIALWSKTSASKNKPDSYVNTIVEEGASIGANATILAGIKIGKYSMIGAGAVVTNDVPEYSMVVGNPARVLKYIKK